VRRLHTVRDRIRLLSSRRAANFNRGPDRTSLKPGRRRRRRMTAVQASSIGSCHTRRMMRSGTCNGPCLVRVDEDVFRATFIARGHSRQLVSRWAQGHRSGRPVHLAGAAEPIPGTPPRCRKRSSPCAYAEQRSCRVRASAADDTEPTQLRVCHRTDSRSAVLEWAGRAAAIGLGGPRHPLPRGGDSISGSLSWHRR
jgi:hypothetical protein